MVENDGGTGRFVRDKCVPCPGVTCRCSEPLYNRSLALRPERDEAVEQRTLCRQCNRSRGRARLVTLVPPAPAASPAKPLETMDLPRNPAVVLSRPPANRRWNGLFAWDEGCGGQACRGNRSSRRMVRNRPCCVTGRNRSTAAKRIGRGRSC